MITVSVAVSVRHIHLNQSDWTKLFGAEEIREDRPVTQPGQFIAQQRVVLRGPKGDIPQVGIVGPLRSYTQVEVSQTDCRHLGIVSPITTSGQLQDAVNITIIGTVGQIEVRAAAVQQRHLHLTPSDAVAFGLRDGQLVSIAVAGTRPTRYDAVLCRVSDMAATMVHLDTDEGNAAGIVPGTTVSVLTV